MTLYEGGDRDPGPGGQFILKDCQGRCIILWLPA